MLKENGMPPGTHEESGRLDAPATLDDSFPAVCTEEWGLINRRRDDLFRKKNRVGLTVEEQVEFERLQRL